MPRRFLWMLLSYADGDVIAENGMLSMLVKVSVWRGLGVNAAKTNGC